MKSLPTSWTVATIGAVTSDCTQRVPAVEDEFLYVDIGSIDRETKTIVSPQKLLGANAPSRARKHIKSGDVLVSMTRPNLNAVALVADDYDGQIASTGFDVLRTSELDPRWLFYFVRTESFVRRMSELVQGALYPAVRSKDIRGVEIPIAPPREQQRIADKLDAVLARVHACRDRLARVPAILKRFRQSVLDAACSGRLSEEWRAANPGKADATRLVQYLSGAHEYAGGHKVGNAAAPTEDVHDLSADLFPQEWALVTLRDIVLPDRPITYGILKPGPELVDGVSYVRVADFPGEKLNLSTIRKTSPKMDEEFKRSRLRPGDILLSIRGTVGRLIVIPKALDGANITQDSARLSIQPAANRDYVLWYLRSEVAQSRMRGATKGVAVRGINIGDVRALQVPLPSRDEQDEIVRRVESLFAWADRLEARHAIARVQVERLTPALLAKAFRGELVPQDASDEPAADVLNRMRRGRGAITDDGTSKRGKGARSPYSKVKAEIIMLARKDITSNHLTSILVDRGALSAEALWNASQLEIDDFYDQLKDEEARGLLKERRGDAASVPRLLEAA